MPDEQQSSCTSGSKSNQAIYLCKHEVRIMIMMLTKERSPGLCLDVAILHLHETPTICGSLEGFTDSSLFKLSWGVSTDQGPKHPFNLGSA
eukprot:365059-Chlamydomonas_euryale.AAC.7